MPSLLQKINVNPILYLLYYFFKCLIVVARWFFYSKRSVANAERGWVRNPCIVVSNHPGTVLDPLNTAVYIHGRELFFLANAGLFKNPVAGWILRKLYCIPVERIQDTGGQPLNNVESFRQSSEFLEKGGTMYVAPEGSSFVERRLRKIKTGTARIAFAAEEGQNFRLGLTILPVGLNYSDPTQFRSQLHTVFGEPIQVADFQQDWETDQVEAVKKLSAKIGERLSEVIIDTADQAEDKLLHCLEILLQNDQPLPSHEHFLRTKKVQADLRAWKEQSPDAHAAFEGQVLQYFEKLKTLNISDASCSANLQIGKTPPIWRLAALLPFALAGMSSHFLPCFLAKKISVQWLNKDLHWIPTYKFLSGLILLPLFYWLQIRLIHHLFDSQWVTWIYALSIIPTGLVAERWLAGFKRWHESRRLATLKLKDGKQVGELLEIQKTIVSQLAQFQMRKTFQI